MGVVVVGGRPGIRYGARTVSKHSPIITTPAEDLGAVTAALPGGGESRHGQVRMAEAVEDAFADKTHLIVQAGTGTGKSLAYLVPAVRAGQRVVIATATKALQEQLAKRDAPLVAAELGGASVAVLKGRQNYACRQRVVELGLRGFQSSLEDQEEQVAESERLVPQVKRLMTWEGTTVSGDRADLAEPVSDKAWSMVSVGPRECPGVFTCPSGSRCFAERARAEASEADIVITNLHLLGADLASAGSVLPEHHLIVIDEAHELEGVMTQCLGIELPPNRLRTVAVSARPLLKADPTVITEVIAASDDLADALLAHPDAAPVELSRDVALASVLQRCDQSLRKLLSSLRNVDPGTNTEAPRTISMATALIEEIGRITAQRPGEVCWVQGFRSQRHLVLSPIEVGPLLHEQLFAESTVILTSATIPPRFAERLRLADGEYRHLDAGSPFDFATQGLLYVPEGLGDRKAGDAEEKMASEIIELVNAAGGRTLALFTSYRALDIVSSIVEKVVQHPILVQRDASSAPQLIEQFREHEDACLFATMGMWQGLDVPGRSLSLVIIDRLPFGRPDDPLLQARRSAVGDNRAFSIIDLPRAATLLAQGAGRLIRSITDEGVVAILDDRLATAGYRKVLLEALPPFKRTRDRDEVLAFLHRIAKA